MFGRTKRKRGWKIGVGVLALMLAVGGGAAAVRFGVLPLEVDALLEVDSNAATGWGERTAVVAADDGGDVVAPTGDAGWQFIPNDVGVASVVVAEEGSEPVVAAPGAVQAVADKGTAVVNTGSGSAIDQRVMSLGGIAAQMDAPNSVVFIAGGDQIIGHFVVQGLPPEVRSPEVDPPPEQATAPMVRLLAPLQGATVEGVKNITCQVEGLAPGDAVVAIVVDQARGEGYWQWPLTVVGNRCFGEIYLGNNETVAGHPFAIALHIVPAEVAKDVTTELHAENLGLDPRGPHPHIEFRYATSPVSVVRAASS